MVTGVVKNLTDYGAFVDLGGIDGLLHVSDMSLRPRHHPSEMLTVGHEITVKVLKFDREKERISLGLKQVAPDPWDRCHRALSARQRASSAASSASPTTALSSNWKPGVEGLIHISEMTWSRRMKHPSKVVKVGDQVEAVVLEVQAERAAHLARHQATRSRSVDHGRMTLQPSARVVEGRVRKLTDFGAFIEIEEGIDGLVHVSDLSWTKRVKHPSELLKKGQMVQAVILSIDARQPASLAGHQATSAGRVGDLLPLAPGGRHRARHACAARRASASLSNWRRASKALCHNSEIPARRSRAATNPPLPIGEELDFKIIKMNEAEKKIGLSMRAVADDEERSRLEDYQRQAAAATMTIEEAINLKSQGEPEATVVSRHSDSGKEKTG